MDTWLIVFVGITALAVLLQSLVWTLTYVRFRRLSKQVSPLLRQLDSILGDLAVILGTARTQAEKFDRVTDELTSRVRVQIIRLDELLGRALATLETAGKQLERSFTAPVREAVAVVQGVKTALNFLAQRRRPEGIGQKPAQRSAAEEELFI